MLKIGCNMSKKVYCPSCQRDIAPKLNLGLNKAMLPIGMSGIIALLITAIYMPVLSLIIFLIGDAIVVVHSKRRRFWYCPVCRTRLNKAK